MMNAYTPATELEAEQLDDLNWATTVLAGFGDEHDNTDAARACCQSWPKADAPP